jgi:ParB family transcriptional regulator, chromosome partitioning protein
MRNKRVATNVVKLEVIAKNDAVVTYTVRQIPIERIRAFAAQPRKWFDREEIHARAESMKLLGQQDPVTVEPVTGDPDHDYELINGESRMRSAIEAGMPTLWAAVRSVPFPSKVDKHLASLVANFNRSDHTPMEISDALHLQVTEGGKSQL